MANSNTFLKRLKGISLSDNEHLALRERLAAYADMHPVLPAAASLSPYSSFFVFFSSHRFPAYALLALLVLTGGGGFTLAAENSVPGDAFYSVKIHVNEPLMTALAPTDVDQARVAARLATRRADEAVTLAVKGKLTDEKQAYLASAFDTQIKKTTERTDDLTNSGDVTAASTVKADLAANLAGEAQALGAVSNASESGARAFLSVIVATSDTLDDSVSGGEVALAFAPPAPAAAEMKVAATSNDSEGADTVHPALMRTSAKIAPKAATTTATTTRATVEKAQLTGRFGHRLLWNATTTLTGKLETNALSLPMVQVDSALQTLPSSLLPSSLQPIQHTDDEELSK